MSPDTPTPSAPRSVEQIFAPIGGHKNGCSLEEYLAVAREVRTLAPCRLLVFGVGEDSAAWIEANAGGTTRFLENNPEWIERIGATIDPGLIQAVDYDLPFEEWDEQGHALDSLRVPRTKDVFDHTWDVIFVDAPWGPTIGRHQSTFAATRAVRPGGLVALHDCERDREQLVCTHVLEAQGFTVEREVERLRLYRAAE